MSDWDEEIREALSQRRANVVDMAYEIIAMDQKLWAQEREIERLLKIEQRYDESITANLKHGKAMMGNMLSLLITPGVGEALVKNGKVEDFEQ